MPKEVRSAQPIREPSKREITGKPLRFGIDIDGTISQAPRHFKLLIDALLERGDEVYIVTGRWADKLRKTQEFLDCLEIRCTELIMRPTDWQGTVPEFKVKIVQEKEIHMMIDDDEENCWAIQQQTMALAAHMLPIPEMPEAREAREEVERETQ